MRKNLRTEKPIGKNKNTTSNIDITEPIWLKEWKTQLQKDIFEPINMK